MKTGSHFHEFFPFLVIKHKMQALYIIVIFWRIFAELEASKKAGVDSNDPCFSISDCKTGTGACKCDRFCELFDDCCPGTINKADARFDKTPYPQPRHMSCQKLINISTSFYWVVDRCQGNEKQCFLPDEGMRISNMLPVTDRHNITYKNHHCAQCHGVTEFRYWRASLSQTASQTCFISIDQIRNSALASSASVEGNVDDLLRKGCALTLYPPVGTTPRQCIHDMVEGDNCSSHFLPVRDSENSVSFRNRDCCEAYVSNCSNSLVFPCVKENTDRKGLSDPFKIMNYRSESELHSTSILFDFSKGLRQKTIAEEMQFANIEFIKQFSLHFSDEISEEQFQSLLCVIKTYYENMDDAFSLEFYEQELLQDDQAPTQPTVSIRAKMISHQYFTERDITTLQAWLENMDIMYSILEVSEETEGKAKVSLTTLTEGQAINLSGNSSKTQIRHLRVADKIQSFTKVLARRNVMCNVLQKGPGTPKTRCHTLNVKVLTNKGTPTFEFACSHLDPTQGNTSSNAESPSSMTTVFLTCIAVALMII